jgi:hypothetical protein
MAKTSKKKPIYGVHPGVKMMADWIAGLPAKTGKSLDQWSAIIKRDGPDDAKARRDWLKEKHGFGTNAAWWLADHADGKALDGDADEYMKQAAKYVTDMYAGGKAGLRPLHDAILDAAAELGADVKACPCQTIVPLYRNHVFAQIKPSTRTRIDLGFALGKYDGEMPARLIDTGGKAKKDRITHRMEITKVEDVDDDVREWLKVAYDLDE